MPLQHKQPVSTRTVILAARVGGHAVLLDANSLTNASMRHAILFHLVSIKHRVISISVFRARIVQCSQHVTAAVALRAKNRRTKCYKCVGSYF